MKSVNTVSKMAAAAAALLAVVSSNEAMASKARVNSLQGAIGLVDTQTIFTQPAYIHKLGQYVTYEFGPTGTAAGKAEGGFVIARDSAKWGAYLGHMSENQRSLRTTATFLQQENPVDLFYGSGDWAVSLSLSNSENGPADTKQTTVIGRFGMVQENQEFYVNVEAIGSAEKTGSKFEGGPAIGAGYLMRNGDLSYSADIGYGMSKVETAGVSTERKDLAIALAVNHRPVAEIYYGAGLGFGNADIGGKKIDILSLPVFIGIEKDMFSWMTVRGSIQQGFLLGSVKNETAAAPGDKAVKNANDTKVAAGLGFKHGGFTLDGTLAAATNGNVNGTNFLTSAALTYVF